MFDDALNLIKKCQNEKSKKLDLSEFYQLKEIPPEITELDHLEELDLRDIDQKIIPGFIGKITSLKTLHLGYRHSRIHPDENKKIVLPKELGKLRNLKTLTLGFEISEIPQWVWNLSNLQNLSIKNDNITEIPPGLGKLRNLHRLEIEGEKIDTLPSETGELSSLKILKIECPKLKVLPDSFAKLVNLKKFDFSKCNLHNLPSYICNWEKLRKLIISMENTFQGPFTDIKRMPENIGNLKKLKSLSLFGTGFTKIPDSISNCPLENLILTGSYKTLPNSFGELFKLKTLELHSDKKISLPESFGSLSALTKLEIRTPFLVLPESFSGLKTLNKLSIETYNVKLPDSFGTLSELRELTLDAEKMQYIPDSIGQCRNLNSFWLKSEKLNKLPDSFCNLKNLKDLYLETFALKELPGKLGNLTFLNNIDIFSGAITELPKTMIKLKDLKTLILDLHNLKELPSWIETISINNIYVHTAKKHISDSQKLIKRRKKPKTGLPEFKDLVKMSFNYRWQLLDTLTVKQIEAILCSAPSRYNASKDEKDVFKNIMLERRLKINKKFKWTDENKKQMIQVSDKFLKAWEEGISKAKLFLNAIYEQDREAYENNHYKAEITLYPEILIDDEDEVDLYVTNIFDKIPTYLNPEVELNTFLDYDPETKKDNMKENIYICRDLSWNIEGFGDLELVDHYICYSLHVLYSHNYWANEDILKINNIITEIKLIYQK